MRAAAWDRPRANTAGAAVLFAVGLSEHADAGLQACRIACSHAANVYRVSLIRRRTR